MYHAKNIILDFDGTIFRVFANHKLDNLISRFCDLTSPYDLGFTEQNDSFDIFKLIERAELDRKSKKALLHQIGEWLVEEEIAALDSGILIDGFLDFLDFAFNNEKNIAIASNNSKECIEKFLERFAPDIYQNSPFSLIGREEQHPERMKPSTYMLEELCKINDWSVSDTVYIGDHPRDYECAKAFGCRFIGMAPTPSKKERLIKYEPSVVAVNDFFELIRLLA